MTASGSAPTLFNKVCKVTAWVQPTAIGGSPPAFFEQLGNGVEITDLRIQFLIEKNLAKEPNKATVTISNLAQQSRLALCKKPLHLRVDAGYADTGARNMFYGDLHFGESSYKVPDWETKVQIGDGARAYAYARVSRSFAAPVPVIEVVRYCASTMNLQLPPDIEQSPDLKAALATGISLHGQTAQLLERILAPYGYHHSVQGGKLQILRDDQTIPGTAILINAGAGLIGLPERAPPEKAGAKGEISFETLLYPELAPGMQVTLQSSDINGTFKLIEVTHRGDTHGDDWKTTCKCLPQ